VSKGRIPPQRRAFLSRFVSNPSVVRHVIRLLTNRRGANVEGPHPAAAAGLSKLKPSLTLVLRPIAAFSFWGDMPNFAPAGVEIWAFSPF
jgi:hypothetical protein